MRVQYRPISDGPWLAGRTANVSRSGVLFEAEALLDVDETVEMKLRLPGQGESGGPDVLCVGRIVRQVPPSNPDAAPVLAATIEEYRFETSEPAR